MRRVRSPCSLEERAQGPIMASHTVRRKLERPVRPPITSEPCLSHTTATKNNGRKRRRENPLTKPDQNGGSTEDGMAAAFAKFGYISRLVYPSRGAPAEYVVVFFFFYHFYDELELIISEKVVYYIYNRNTRLFRKSILSRFFGFQRVLVYLEYPLFGLI